MRNNNVDAYVSATALSTLLKKWREKSRKIIIYSLAYSGKTSITNPITTALDAFRVKNRDLYSYTISDGH